MSNPLPPSTTDSDGGRGGRPWWLPDDVDDPAADPAVRWAITLLMVLIGLAALAHLLGGAA